MSSLPIRPDLVGKKAYGAPQLDVPVKLNTNENPFSHELKFAQLVSNELSQVIIGANRYPDRDAITLREKLAQYLSKQTGIALGFDQIWPANGSNEVLMQLFQLFGGPDRVAVGFEPSYSMHPIIAQLTNTGWIALNRNQNFEIYNLNITSEITGANIVVICTPNNPTGGITNLELIKKIHDETSGIVIVDEAYAEFSDAPSATTLFASCDRLAVVRTMSKAFGFAGVRLGYVAGSTELISALQLVRLPYHLSSLTQQAAILALDTADELQKKVDQLISGRKQIVSTLTDMGFKTVNSEANFVLFGTFRNQAEIWEYLFNRGVLVRDVGIPGWLRVTCGTPEENNAFLSAMAELKDDWSIRENQ